MTQWLDMLPSVGSNVAMLGVVGLAARLWFGNVNKRLDRIPRDFRAEIEKTNSELTKELKEMRGDIKGIQLNMARTEASASIVTRMKEDFESHKEHIWKQRTQIEALFKILDNLHLQSPRLSDVERKK